LGREKLIKNSTIYQEKENILLVNLPFWTPFIPPMGIASLKSYLQAKGYRVTTLDANIEIKFRNFYDQYFNQLKGWISKGKRGNFLNIGHDVLRNHMMAYINQEDKGTYREVVKEIVFKTFFTQFQAFKILQLDIILNDFFSYLKTYILEKMEQMKPSVLGLSVFSGNLPSSIFTFKLVKEEYPSINTVMGGGVFADQLALGSPNLDYFIDHTPYIDKIIIGEGEQLFLKWLKGELPGDKKVSTLKDIGEKTEDINRLAIPDFSDFNLDYYQNLVTCASRGCPYQCQFCSERVRWGTYRKKKPEQVVQECVTLYEEYGIQLYLMSDSLLNPVITGLSKAMGKKDAPFYWDGYLRVDKEVCSTANTTFWRQGGFYRARLGVESGSQKILKKMNKKITKDQIRESLYALAQAGIKTTTYWIIGYPGETEEDFEETLKFIEILEDNLYEAEGNAYWCYLFGEPETGPREEKYRDLYTPEAKKLVMIQTWMKEGEPSRETIYKRLNRFVQHCEKLGIPNPYTLKEIYKADERWKHLHRNAVPSLVEFRNKEVRINEKKEIKILKKPGKKYQEMGDFDF
jgi:radical SAM superfamily enzyme YgiQ (UPF0313 family)